LLLAIFRYYRQGQLVFSAKAVFDKGAGKAEVEQYGERLGMEAFKEFFKAVGDGKKAAGLKEIYQKIRKNYPDLPAPGTKNVMTQALRDYEANNQDKCVLIQSKDQLYGIAGSSKLDNYLQWVFVPAVKDAATEQMEARNTALGKILARTVRAKINFSERLKKLRDQIQGEYQKLLDGNQDALEDISTSLQKRLAEWSHPDVSLRLEWNQDPQKSVRIDEPWAKIITGEGKFEGELSRFGHGLQRSYLLALLQELSGCDDTQGPRLLLACEEPELYQHPPQARHLFNVFQKLSQDNSQVIISTHSPYFVSGERFEDIRLVRKEESRSKTFSVTFQEISEKIRNVGKEQLKPEGIKAKIHQALQPQLNEMFFTPRLILVEGLEDYAYITTYLNLMALWDEFRLYGCHIVPTDGKSKMIRPLAITKSLKIPTFVVFDSDGHERDKQKRRCHEKDNIAILKLCGINSPEPFPCSDFWYNQVVMWKSEIELVVKNDIGEQEWQKYREKAHLEYGQAKNLKKNVLDISATLISAWENSGKSANLEKLCQKLIKFAKNS